jgi:hypothetical protein
MGGNQPEPRETADLPVRVWGMSAEGRPFSQNARAQNISSDGALLSGVESELKVGDVIGIQYGDKKARCTVVWVMNTGPAKKNQVGVKLVADQECPWKSHLGPESSPTEVAPSNRRHYARHKISFPLELRDERVGTPMRINATDVSGNGCYVETIMPFAAGTAVRVDFWMQSEHLTARAVVRTCDPGVGMGIEFTGLVRADKERLQRYLDGINPALGISRPTQT